MPSRVLGLGSTPPTHSIPKLLTACSIPELLTWLPSQSACLLTGGAVSALSDSPAGDVLRLLWQYAAQSSGSVSAALGAVTAGQEACDFVSVVDSG